MQPPIKQKRKKERKMLKKFNVNYKKINKENVNKMKWRIA
jgi:hypothetical protein